MSENKRYYTVGEFADILDVPTRDIYQMINAGIFEPAISGKNIRFTRDQITKYVDRYYQIRLYLRDKKQKNIWTIARYYGIKIVPKDEIIDDIAERAVDGEPLDYIMMSTKIPKSIIKRVIKIRLEMESPGIGRGKALLPKGAAGSGQPGRV